MESSSARDERMRLEGAQANLGRFVFGPANGRVISEVRASEVIQGGETSEWTKWSQFRRH